MKRLITSSLLDGFDWLKTCPEGWRKRAMDDFIAMLKREERPTTPACQRGIDFESLVCANCNAMTDDEFGRFAESHYASKGLEGERLRSAVEVAREAARRCRGGRQQVKVMMDVEADGAAYHLFGCADVVHPDLIIDIKTCGRFKGNGHYLRRSQHHVYALCAGIGRFEYAVADCGGGRFPREFRSVGVGIDFKESMEIIKTRIKELMRFLELGGLMGVYEETFTGLHRD